MGLFSSVNAGIVQGKNTYFEKLREPCGFTGDIMGKKYTSKEWEHFYNDKTLASVIKQECPHSRLIIDKKELYDLYKFFITFAKDTGNTPACDTKE
jgi:hypothetical protein